MTHSEVNLNELNTWIDDNKDELLDIIAKTYPFLDKEN